MRRTLPAALLLLTVAAVLSIDASSPARAVQLRDMRFENVAAIAVASDGRTVATGERTSLVKFWDAQSRSVKRSLRGHTAQISALAFSPDGTILASGSYDPSIRIWDVRSGEEKLRLGDHPGHVKSLAFSSDGRLLVSTGADGARVWDLTLGSLQRMIPTSRGVVAAVFAPGDRTVAIAGGNGVALWDVATGKRIRSFSSSRNELILALAFSPDGRLLAGGGTGRTVKLWDTRSGELRASSEPGGDAVRAMAFTSDGSSLVVIDRTAAHLWEPQSGRSHPLSDRTGFSVVAVSSNGQLLAAAAGDDRIEVWPARRVTR